MDRERSTTAHAAISLLVLALTVAVAAGCGGESAESAASDRPSAQSYASEAAQPAAAAAPAAPFDFAPKPAVPGFERHQGSCDSYFRYTFQHPAEWEVENSTNGAARMRVDDEIFSITVIGDLGEIHAARMNDAAKAQGVEKVGEIAVGGRRVDVYRSDPQRYAFQVPRPASGTVMYHQFQVWSTFGVEEILRILDTLEPIEGCE